MTEMRNEDGETIASAPHAQQIVRMRLPGQFPVMTMLRKRREKIESEK